MYEVHERARRLGWAFVFGSDVRERTAWDGWLGGFSLGKGFSIVVSESPKLRSGAGTQV